MMITSLSFAYLQYSSTPAAAAAQPVAGAPAPAPRPVAQDECCGHNDTPRRSALFRALKHALTEMAQSATPAAGAPASGAAATDATAANNETAATNQTSANADASPELDDALMAFARTLMQVMRDEFGGRRERAQGQDDGRGHHHHGHGHGHGHGRWGDPAQRVEALAQQVSAPARNTPAGTGPAGETTPSPALGDVTTEPVNATAVADATHATNGPVATASAAGTTSTVIFVASIQVKQADVVPDQMSPYAGPHQRLLDAFAAVQKALGKPEAVSGDALKGELGIFLQALAERLRGEDSATAEAATQPGALLSVAA